MDQSHKIKTPRQNEKKTNCRHCHILTDVQHSVSTMGDTNGDKKRSHETTAVVRNGPRLLLHCVDGCVPYLNPNQLEEHFPPSENADLWLGLAVRDACVTPVFQTNSDTSKKGKPNKKESKPANINKVRGYTFAALSPDPWLLPYTRLTVPSFGSTEHGASGGATSGSSKNGNNAVHVWTPHGRQKLTPDLYATASLEGLQSQHTLALFDDFDEDDFSMRRLQKANARNEQWFQHLCSTEAAEKPSLWKPILLPHPPQESDGKDETTKSSVSHPKKEGKVEDAPQHIPSGVAFVGQWRPDIQLDTILASSDLNGVPWKAILTTRSLSDILEIATAGVANLIGTNLPQKWAKNKLALGLDLSVIETMLNSENHDLKRQKTDSAESTNDSETNDPDKTLLNQDGCMDLSNTIYARDTRPLVPGCDSFVCRENRFSRAYIHHLVVAKEMVAEILLFGHNLHCLLKLLRCFDCDESKRKEVKDLILGQISS